MLFVYFLCSLFKMKIHSTNPDKPPHSCRSDYFFNYFTLGIVRPRIYVSVCTCICEKLPLSRICICVYPESCILYSVVLLRMNVCFVSSVACNTCLPYLHVGCSIWCYLTRSKEIHPTYKYPRRLQLWHVRYVNKWHYNGSNWWRRSLYTRKLYKDLAVSKINCTAVKVVAVGLPGLT